MINGEVILIPQPVELDLTPLPSIIGEVEIREEDIDA